MALERHLQFRRNNEVYPNYKTCYNALIGLVTSTTVNLADGEQVFGRYYIEGTNEAKVATLVGYVYKKGDVTTITISQTSTSEIGDDYDTTEYDEMFLAKDDVANVTSSMTVSEAVSTVEHAVDVLVDEVLTNEETIANTVDKITEAAGIVGPDGKIAYQKHTNDKFLSGATSLDSADVALSNALDAVVEQLTKDSITTIEIGQKLNSSKKYTDADADTYAVSATTGEGNTTETDTFQLTFTPYSPNTLKVPSDVGGIEKGTTASDLAGRPLSNILDDILFPTIYPALTNPTASITTAATLAATVELGSSMENLKTTYTKGKATVNDGVTEDKDYTKNYTGVKVQYCYTAATAATATNTNAGISNSGTTIASGTPEDVTTAVTSSTTSSTVGGSDVITSTMTGFTFSNVGVYKFRSVVSYAEGDTLSDSKGATTNPMRYESLNGSENTDKSTVVNPHPASTVTSSYGVSVNVSLPIFANSGTTYSETTKKLPIAAWGAITNSNVTFPTTNASTPIIIETPRKLNTFNSYNDLSGKYDVPQKSNLGATPVEIEKEFGGIKVKYYRYTWTGSEVSGRKYEIKTY